MEDKKQNNSTRGVFYAVVGIATLIVAIIGATFAYFTATAQNGVNEISGNMASIGFDLVVTRVINPGETSGMIPLSNTMVETAINDTTDGTNDTAINQTCVDDNGNAVCQVYKITVSNNSSATMFVDGYVALAGGSGTPVDITPAANAKNPTTMRWAQVFKQGGNADNISHYSTAGTQYLSVNHEEAAMSINSIDSSDPTGFNRDNIKTSTGIITANGATISGNRYDAVGTNFIRISEHNVVDGVVDASNFTRTADLTSMLVINQQLAPKNDPSTYDKIVYYFVVWLSENGHDQTATSTTGSDTLVATQNSNFFNGVVKFISAQGSEVTATFSGYTAVRSDKAVSS
ncbi:MAG: hypothetical protein VZS44_01025 [Bacilli bacterium]|nr:hypothetical protein [Bacilli bacterium]